jgi:hypothetical protein
MRTSVIDVEKSTIKSATTKPTAVTVSSAIRSIQYMIRQHWALFDVYDARKSNSEIKKTVLKTHVVSKHTRSSHQNVNLEISDLSAAADPL